MVASMSESPARPRTIYGRRLGRPLRPGRQRLLDDRLPELAVPLPARPGTLDPKRLFARPVEEVWLEVGFGNGEHLAALAAAHPEIGLIGCEPFLNGVAALLAAVEAEGLDNVRIHADDARQVLDALPDASVGRVFVLFPDPWPKARHHKRRFIRPETLDRLARVLAEGGVLRLASDDAPLVDWMLWQTRRHPAFAWTARRAADWRERPADWPPTRYEAKRLHGTPAFLDFRRRPR